MGLTTRLLRLPRPKTFLYTMSLTTGASLITLSLLLNKVSGLYGLLALLTGFHLNSLQFSMYIYSLFALALTAYLAPHIRTQSPLHCLALAWFYVIDSIVNAAYTAAFGVTWFLVLAQHHAGKSPSEKGPGAGTIDETSGFTKPEHNVSSVQIKPGEDDIVSSTPASSPAGTSTSNSAASAPLTHPLLQPSSMNSLGVIIALWTIRLYFCVVMLSYARMVLRQHIALASVKNNTYTTASSDSGMAEDPFAAGKAEGRGWRGRAGRAMLRFPRVYWLGREEEGEDQEGGAGGQDVRWMEGMGGRFRKGGVGAAAEGGGGGGGGGAGSIGLGNAVEAQSGPLERERRRRSGTGPPLPSVQLTMPGGQKGLSVPLQDLS